jgi:hypothetical protein
MNKEIHESPITGATIAISYCHYFHVQGFHISDQSPPARMLYYTIR